MVEIQSDHENIFNTRHRTLSFPLGSFIKIDSAAAQQRQQNFFLGPAALAYFYEACGVFLSFSNGCLLDLLGT